MTVTAPKRTFMGRDYVDPYHITAKVRLRCSRPRVPWLFADYEYELASGRVVRVYQGGGGGGDPKRTEVAGGDYPCSARQLSDVGEPGNRAVRMRTVGRLRASLKGRNLKVVRSKWVGMRSTCPEAVKAWEEESAPE